MSKKKILVMLSLAAACGFGLTACKTDEPSTPPTPPTPPVEEEGTITVKFEGKNTINNKEYNCILKCYDDNKFKLEIGNVKTFEGSWLFTDGVGYTFTFTDSSNSVITTSWDEATKSHKLTYTVRLGDLGSGDITVSLKDEDFVLAVKDARDEFISNVKFTGLCKTSKFGDYVYDLTFDDEGKFHIRNDKSMQMLYIDGDYTYENNVFTIKVPGRDGQVTEFKSEFDITTGTYTIPFVLRMEETVEFDLTYNGWSADGLVGVVSDVFGKDFKVTLTVDGNGNAFFDGSWGDGTNEMYEKMFDKKGTYTVADNVYTFKVGDKTFTSTYDSATGEYTVPYSIQGHDMSLDFVLKGTDFVAKTFTASSHEETQMGNMNFVLELTSANSCIVKTITGHSFMDGYYLENGEYVLGSFDFKGDITVENGIIKIALKMVQYETTGEGQNKRPVIGEDGKPVVKAEIPVGKMESVWNEDEGTYTFKLSVQGPEMTIGTDLVVSVWK